MSAMCEVPVRVVDELPGVECRGSLPERGVSGSLRTAGTCPGGHAEGMGRLVLLDARS